MRREGGEQHEANDGNPMAKRGDALTFDTGTLRGWGHGLQFALASYQLMLDCWENFNRAVKLRSR
jgi:hypothetical protein